MQELRRITNLCDDVRYTVACFITLTMCDSMCDRKLGFQRAMTAFLARAKIDANKVWAI